MIAAQSPFLPEQEIVLFNARLICPFSGRDDAVARYVMESPGAKQFLEQYLPVLQTVAAGYLVEGKRFMTVAVGCTGGKHRSVAMTEEIARRLALEGIDTRPMHRDLGRE